MGVSNVGIVAGAPIAGARIMVVEDNAVIALDIGVRPEDAGCVVLGSVHLLCGRPCPVSGGAADAALLDMELSDGPAAPVAEALARAEVPFAVITGFEAEDSWANLALPPPGQAVRLCRRRAGCGAVAERRDGSLVEQLKEARD